MIRAGTPYSYSCVLVESFSYCNEGLTMSNFSSLIFFNHNSCHCITFLQLCTARRVYILRRRYFSSMIPASIQRSYGFVLVILCSYCKEGFTMGNISYSSLVFFNNDSCQCTIFIQLCTGGIVYIL